MKRDRRVLRNMLFAFAAQGISLLLSILTSLILPKFLVGDNYGYWSAFIFYTGYTGFFHFGLNDGVYLKIGGIEYEDMDKKLLGAQFRFGAIFQSIIGIGIVVGTYFFADDGNRLFVFIMTAVYMLLFNLSLYLGCIFQAANETRLYSISVIIDKVIFAVSIVALFVCKYTGFRLYVWLYMLAKVCALIYCIYIGREIVFAKRIKVSTTLKESLDSIKVGINLTVANIAGLLILGIGRIFVDIKWDINLFGELSFSFTLTNFFLQFISQISMVLFPALRQIDAKEQKTFYSMAKHILNVILPVVFVAYIPAKEILLLWLPRFEKSLTYMALLLPLCIFDGKMNLVCSTFFKVLRKEKFLLVVNMIALAFSAITCAFSTFVLNSIDWIVVFMVVSTGVRYVISYIYLEKILGDKDKFAKELIYLLSEFILMVACSYVCYRHTSLIAIAVCIPLYLIYLLINKDSVRYVINKLGKKIA